jgi:hypothetical protein
MPDQFIKISYLDFLDQLQVLLAHFEKNLDIPALAVQSNDFFASKGCISTKKCRPAALFIARATNNFTIMPYIIATSRAALSAPVWAPDMIFLMIMLTP